MYDTNTANLIRSTPPLNGLDREALPDILTKAYAEIAALRVQLRADENLPDDLAATRTFAHRLAQTNEGLVTLSPERQDRRAAAFVAATAYQLVHQIDVLTGTGHPSTQLTSGAITPDLSAMLLFLVAESSADAAEVSQRIREPEETLQRLLVQSLVDLACGRVSSIVDRPVPPSDDAIRFSEPDAPSDALYHLIFRAVSALARSLAGQPTVTDDPSGTLRRAQTLAAPTEDPVPLSDSEPGGLPAGPVAAFPGPFHLASLLLAVAGTLTDAAVVGVPPPGGVEPGRWASFLRQLARGRPYLWPNHREAVAKQYLNPGVSSVVGFPTGAGKSAVAQMKIAATLLSDSNAIFLAPTHALVDQTVRDLRAAFPDFRVQGERTDDLPLATELEDPQDILVMTPERCLLLAHISPDIFDSVELLVFDECHLIHPSDDADRRSVDAMLCIINFVRLSPDADLLLLSAMMKNTAELADWIRDLTGRPALPFSMAWKPTRQLRGCVVYDQSRLDELVALLRAGRQRATTAGVPAALKRELTAKPYGFFSIRQTWASQRRADYAYLPFSAESPVLAANSSWRLTPNAGVVAATLASSAARTGINTLVFAQSIPVAASIARRAADSLGPCEVELTDPERRWFDIAVDELGDRDQLYVDCRDGSLVSRAATHHGQLLPEERRLIESLYARPEGLTVLCATATLGQGMNLPSELVVIAEDSRFDQQSGRREMLEARELLNAAGRAGRAGKNTTGLVVVIPGRLVGFNDTDSKIGSQWVRLREVFSQTDQCLEIDDPLSAILDRVHGAAHTPDDLDRYVVSRLAGPTGDEQRTELRSALRRTFTAFRKRRDSDQTWIQTRTDAAVALLSDVDPDDDVAQNLRDLAASLGLPEDALAQLRVDVLDSAPDFAATTAEWTNWMFEWMATYPHHTIRLLRPDDLSDQFGTAIDSLTTDQARVTYALPKLADALARWMRGDPLKEIESALPAARSSRRKSTAARKFVIRILPTLAHLFSAPSLVIGRELFDDWAAAQDVAPGAFHLSQCVRHGFPSLEMYALYEQARRRNPSRRQVHRMFGACEPHLPPAPSHQTWTNVSARVARAVALTDL